MRRGRLAGIHSSQNAFERARIAENFSAIDKHLILFAQPEDLSPRHKDRQHVARQEQEPETSGLRPEHEILRQHVPEPALRHCGLRRARGARGKRLPRDALRRLEQRDRFIWDAFRVSAFRRRRRRSQQKKRLERKNQIPLHHTRFGSRPPQTHAMQKPKRKIHASRHQRTSMVQYELWKWE